MSNPKRTASRRTILAVGGAGTLIALAALYLVFRGAGGSGGSLFGGASAGAYTFAVGQPGVGQPAPLFSLASTTGTTFDLSAQKGRTVLLYFQEGISCEPCWKQIVEIEQNSAAFKQLGIDQVVSVTSNDVGALRQKASDEGITTAVLSDPDLKVSRQYAANQYGMMGTGADGHTFIVVGPDGLIRWRADYGGAPNFTMYVPVQRLLDQLRAGLART
ncbi:MAG: peroxiredoxin family protein [Candidatus Dormibacteria bacterium]